MDRRVGYIGGLVVPQGRKCSGHEGGTDERANGGEPRVEDDPRIATSKTATATYRTSGATGSKRTAPKSAAAADNAIGDRNMHGVCDRSAGN